MSVVEVPSDQGRGDRLAAGRHDGDLAFVGKRFIRVTIRPGRQTNPLERERVE